MAAAHSRERTICYVCFSNLIFFFFFLAKIAKKHAGTINYLTSRACKCFESEWHLELNVRAFRSIHLIHHFFAGPRIPDWCLPRIANLLQMTWQTNPNDRPSFLEIDGMFDEVIYFFSHSFSFLLSSPYSRLCERQRSKTRTSASTR